MVRRSVLLLLALLACGAARDAGTDGGSQGSIDDHSEPAQEARESGKEPPPPVAHPEAHPTPPPSPAPSPPLSPPPPPSQAGLSAEQAAVDGNGAGEGNLAGECQATEEEECQQCHWTSTQGVAYSLQDISTKIFRVNIQGMKGFTLQFSLCPSDLTCNGRSSQTCLSVPGIRPSSTGTTLSIEQIEPHAPSRGFKMILTDGDICEVTRKPRVTTFVFPCTPGTRYPPQSFEPVRVMEGKGESICRYVVEFPNSRYGCPALPSDGGMSRMPQLSAVLGCVDSIPLRFTTDCHYASRIQLTLEGLNFDFLCPQSPSPVFSPSHCTQYVQKHYSIYVGVQLCRDAVVLSEYALNCSVENGRGKGLSVSVHRQSGSVAGDVEDVRGGDGSGGGGAGVRGEVVMLLEGAVSFKESINFREKFSKFVELGVGGMKREIEELYRRAFASRGISPEVLQNMGISHVKGILLHGPPGSGKTLLARTIANILGSKQVQLINGPEIVSKYLGESERNLRAHFQPAQEAWRTHGMRSELFVVIIDEIDAICKPRGKTDQSAAGAAYDALVNQLLTLMDGLQETHNTIVVGMTNRKELLDPALLRPGRFEVQIEVGLPDEEGRREIFEIHTRSMRASGMLAGDVVLAGLAANTTRFSGAEIAGVVRAASSYALERHQTSDMKDSILVTAADFEQALYSVNPAYTHSENHVLSKFLPLGYLSCGESHDAVIDLTLDTINTLRHSSISQLNTILLYGPRGSGKTALAAHLAVMGKFSFVKVLTASAVIGRSTLHKVDSIRQAFADAFSSELGLVVLDDLHRLVEYVRVASQVTVSHEILHTITTMLTAAVPPGVKVLVIGTLTVDDGATLDDAHLLGLPDLFLQHHHVPLLGVDGVLTLLRARAIHRVGGGQFSLPSNLEVSVRQLLLSIECACVQGACSGGRGQPSMVHQDRLLDCIMAFVTRQMAELNDFNA